MNPAAPVMLTASTVIVLPSLLWSATSMLPVTAAPAAAEPVGAADAVGAFVAELELSSLPHAPSTKRPTIASPAIDERVVVMFCLLLVVHDEGAVHGGMDLAMEREAARCRRCNQHDGRLVVEWADLERAVV